DHHRGQETDGDQEIDQAGHDGAGRDDQAREIDFGDQVGVADQAVAGFGERGGEELPGQQSGEHEQRVWDVGGRRQLGDFAEHEREHDHRDERPDQGPGDADDSLFVADEDVAPGEEIEQLAVPPKVAPVLALGAAGLDDYGFTHGPGKTES